MTHGFNPARRLDVWRALPSWRRAREKLERMQAQAALAEQLRRPLIPERKRIREYGP